jgi:bifunctional polynucleotide phosphatase/kinase
MVGDAAGRSSDHSDDDRHFAMNLEIGFYTPEEYFLKKPPEPWQHKFDPTQYLDAVGSHLRNSNMYAKENDQQTLALLVGLPGSGKTTHWLTELRTLGYERVTPQSAASQVECLDIATEKLRGGRSIVVGKLSCLIQPV